MTFYTDLENTVLSALFSMVRNVFYTFWLFVLTVFGHNCLLFNNAFANKQDKIIIVKHKNSAEGYVAPGKDHVSVTCKV